MKKKNNRKAVKIKENAKWKEKEERKQRVRVIKKWEEGWKER